jgi:hypothetical protein
VIAAVAAATIWGAITGFLGTRAWQPGHVCFDRYQSDRFALVQFTRRGHPHVAALHLYSKRAGWVVMWLDGTVNPKIDLGTRGLVLGEVTRLKAKCLAP